MLQQDLEKPLDIQVGSSVTRTDAVLPSYVHNLGNGLQGCTFRINSIEGREVSATIIEGNSSKGATFEISRFLLTDEYFTVSSFKDEIEEFAGQIHDMSDYPALIPGEKELIENLLAKLNNKKDWPIAILLPLVSSICDRIEDFANAGLPTEVSKYFEVLEAVYSLGRSPDGVSARDRDVCIVEKTLGYTGRVMVQKHADFVTQLFRRFADLNEGLFAPRTPRSA